MMGNTLVTNHESRNSNVKKGSDYTKVKHLSNIVNPFGVTYDSLQAH